VFDAKFDLTWQSDALLPYRHGEAFPAFKTVSEATKLSNKSFAGDRSGNVAVFRFTSRSHAVPFD
jgi:hypothetical protein